MRGRREGILIVLKGKNFASGVKPGAGTTERGGS